MRQSMPDSALDAVCARWVGWHRVHRLIAPPVPKNILARMQPGRVRRAPAIGLSRELSLLNLAINAQPQSPAKLSFLIFYLYPARTVKEAAAAQGITRDAFYRRVRRFRRRAWQAACRLDATVPRLGRLPETLEGALAGDDGEPDEHTAPQATAREKCLHQRLHGIQKAKSPVS